MNSAVATTLLAYIKLTNSQREEFERELERYKSAPLHKNWRQSATKEELQKTAQRSIVAGPVGGGCHCCGR